MRWYVIVLGVLVLSGIVYAVEHPPRDKTIIIGDVYGVYSGTPVSVNCLGYIKNSRVIDGEFIVVFNQHEVWGDSIHCDVQVLNTHTDVQTHGSYYPYLNKYVYYGYAIVEVPEARGIK